MTVKDIRQTLNLTQKEFAEMYHIPLQTLKQWESDPASKSYRRPPDYLLFMMEKLMEQSHNEAFAVKEEDHTSDFRPQKDAGDKAGLLYQLIEQRDAKVSGQLYEQTQVEMAYNSNKIEGSTLTLLQAQLLYTDNKVPGNSDYNDLVEMKNHFALFDFMLDTADLLLSHDLIKEYHRLLKTGTDQSRLPWFAVGDYKKLPCVIGAGTPTTPPEEVYGAMDSLIKAYNRSGKSFEDIVDFHARFEKIHPFQDGNGRVGRILLFKECLANGITPPVVLDRQKVSYINGLADYYEHPSKLLRTMEKFQKQYQKEIDKFAGEA